MTNPTGFPLRRTGSTDFISTTGGPTHIHRRTHSGGESPIGPQLPIELLGPKMPKVGPNLPPLYRDLSWPKELLSAECVNFTESTKKNWYEAACGETTVKFHVDFEKGEVGFYKPQLGGAVMMHGQTANELLYRSYKIYAKDRLDEKYVKELATAAYSDPKAFETTIIRFFNAKPMKKPDPRMESHFYGLSLPENANLPIDLQKYDFLRIALAIDNPTGERLSADQLAVAVDRLKCFDLFEKFKSLQPGRDPLNAFGQVISLLVSLSKQLHTDGNLSDTEFSAIVKPIRKLQKMMAQAQAAAEVAAPAELPFKTMNIAGELKPFAPSMEVPSTGSRVLTADAVEGASKEDVESQLEPIPQRTPDFDDTLTDLKLTEKLQDVDQMQGALETILNLLESNPDDYIVSCLLTFPPADHAVWQALLALDDAKRDEINSILLRIYNHSQHIETRNNQDRAILATALITYPIGLLASYKNRSADWTVGIHYMIHFAPFVKTLAGGFSFVNPAEARKVESIIKQYFIYADRSGKTTLDNLDHVPDQADPKVADEATLKRNPSWRLSSSDIKYAANAYYLDLHAQLQKWIDADPQGNLAMIGEELYEVGRFTNKIDQIEQLVSDMATKVMEPFAKAEGFDLIRELNNDRRGAIYLERIKQMTIDEFELLTAKEEPDPAPVDDDAIIREKLKDFVTQLPLKKVRMERIKLIVEYGLQYRGWHLDAENIQKVMKDDVLLKLVEYLKPNLAQLQKAVEEQLLLDFDFVKEAIDLATKGKRSYEEEKRFSALKNRLEDLFEKYDVPHNERRIALNALETGYVSLGLFTSTKISWDIVSDLIKGIVPRVAQQVENKFGKPEQANKEIVAHFVSRLEPFYSQLYTRAREFINNRFVEFKTTKDEKRRRNLTNDEKALVCAYGLTHEQLLRLQYPDPYSCMTQLKALLIGHLQARDFALDFSLLQLDASVDPQNIYLKLKTNDIKRHEKKAEEPFYDAHLSSQFSLDSKVDSEHKLNRKGINTVLNEQEYRYVWRYGNRRDSGQVRQEEIFCHGLDQIDKAIGYFADHPLEMDNRIDLLNKAIFDVYKLRDLIEKELEVPPATNLLSVQIPEKLAKICSNLTRSLQKSGTTWEDRRQLLGALTNTYIFAHTLKNFLKDSGVNLDNYSLDYAQDYRDMVLNRMSKDLSQAERSREAVKYLNTFAGKNVQWTEQEWEVAGYVTTPDQVENDALRNARVRHFWEVVKTECRLAGATTLPQWTVEGRSSTLYRITYLQNGVYETESMFLDEIRNNLIAVGIIKEKATYNKNEITELFKEISGKDLSAYPITESTENPGRWMIGSTPYNFGNGKIYLNMIGDDGKPYVGENGKPVVGDREYTPDIAEHLPACLESYTCFVNTSNPEEVWLHRDGKDFAVWNPKLNSIVRLADNAIGAVTAEAVVWHEKVEAEGAAPGGNDRYAPTSYLEQAEPYGEYNLVAKDGKMYSESRERPGYFLTNSKFIYTGITPLTKDGIDLGNTDDHFPKSVILEKESGDKMLVCEIYGQQIELELKDGRLDAKPWQLLAFILESGNLMLLNEFRAKWGMFLKPRSDFEIAVSEKLNAVIEFPPTPENVVGWMHLAAIDAAMHGTKAKLFGKKMQVIQAAVEAYVAHRNIVSVLKTGYAPKDTERLFLIQIKRWFEVNDPKLFAQSRVGFGIRNVWGGLIQKFPWVESFLTPLLGAPMEFEQIMQRGVYGLLVDPLMTDRIQELTTGEDLPERWKRLRPMNVEETLETLKKEEKTTSGYAFLPQILELAEKVEPIQIPETLTVDFVRSNIAKLYIYAQNASKDDRLSLLMKLQMIPISEDNNEVNWLTEVVEHIHKYPPVSALKARTKEIQDLKERKRKLITDNEFNDTRTPDQKMEDAKTLSSLESRIEHIENKLASSMTCTPRFSLLKKIWNFAFTNKTVMALESIQKRPVKVSNVGVEKSHAHFKRELTPPTQEEFKTLLGEIDQKYDENFLNLQQYFVEREELEASATMPTIGEDETQQKVAKDIQTWREESRNYEYSFKIEDKGTLDRDVANLKERVANLHLELEKCKKKVVNLANETKSDDAFIKRLLSGKKLDWNHLVALMDKNKEYTFTKHLGDTNVQTLRLEFYKILCHQARIHQYDRILEKLVKIQDSYASQPNGSQLPESQVRELYEQLTATRSYKGDKPEMEIPFLFLDAASPKGLYRAIQKEKVEKIATEEDKKAAEDTGAKPGEAVRPKLAEMPTGAGKTDYIIVMLNRIIKKLVDAIQSIIGEKQAKVRLHITEVVRKLIVNVWPEANLASDMAAIKERTAAAVGSEVFELHFSREDHLDSVHLEFLYDQIKKAAKRGHAISVTADDLASINLHFVEVMETVVDGEYDVTLKDELLKQVEQYKNILCLLYTDIWSSIDEAHYIQDPMQRTIYTIGNGDEPPEEAVTFALDFFALLDKHSERFRQIMTENQTLTPAQLAVVQDEIFDDAVLKAIAELFKVRSDKEGINAFRQFLHGKGPMPLVSAENKSNMNLIRGYYVAIVTSALGGAVGVQFGLSRMFYDSDKYKCKFAIPYMKRDVPRESAGAGPSNYQNLDETLFKTIRTYYTGDNFTSENMVDLFMKYWDLTQSENLEEKINAQIEVDKLYAEYPELKTKNLEKEDRGTIPALVREAMVLRQPNKKWIPQFMRLCVAPFIKQYTKTIGFNPQDLLMMMEKSASVTATPQNQKTHSLKTKFIAMAGATGKKFDLLFTKMKAIRRLVDDEAEFVAGIVAGCKERNIRAVSDPSGLRQFDAAFVKKLAEKIKEDPKNPIQYIVYHDYTQDGARLRYDVKKGQAMPYSESFHRKNMDATITLYDQAHSTGTDIPQSPEAVLILLAAASTTAVEAGQGVGRMRQLEKGQSYELWTRDLDIHTTPAPKDERKNKVLNKFLDNEGSVNKPKHRVAIRQLMEAEVRNAMMRKMLGIPVKGDGAEKRKANHSVQDTLNAFTMFRDQFVTETPYDPNEQYGHIGEMRSVRQVLSEEKEKLKTKAKAYLNGKESKMVANILDEYEKIWVVTDPSKKPKVSLPEEEFAVEIGAEVSAEVNTQTQLNTAISESISLKEQPSWYRWMGEKKAWPQNLTDMAFEPTGFGFTKGKDEVRLAAVSKELQKIDVSMRDITACFSSSFFITNNAYEDRAFANALLESDLVKPISHILLVQEVVKNSEGRDEKVYKAVALDNTDERQLHRLLAKMRKQGKKSPNEPEFALYNLALDAVVDRSPGAFEGKTLEDPAVRKLVVEGKLFAGRTNYNIYEQKILVDLANSIYKDNSIKGKTLITNFVQKVDREKDPLRKTIRYYAVALGYESGRQAPAQGIQASA